MQRAWSCEHAARARNKGAHSARGLPNALDRRLRCGRRSCVLGQGAEPPEGPARSEWCPAALWSSSLRYTGCDRAPRHLYGLGWADQARGDCTASRVPVPSPPPPASRPALNCLGEIAGGSACRPFGFSSRLAPPPRYWAAAEASLPGPLLCGFRPARAHSAETELQRCFSVPDPSRLQRDHGAAAPVGIRCTTPHMNSPPAVPYTLLTHGPLLVLIPFSPNRPQPLPAAGR